MDGWCIPVDELRAIYNGEQAVFRYDQRGLQRALSRHHAWRPGATYQRGDAGCRLLLVRSGEHRVAIQVDSLLGNRQIVVKSVRAQLSTVRWFTGGTIPLMGRLR